MKKIYQIIMLCVTVVALASCGGSSTAEPGDYQEACQRGDYEKAHKILGVLHDQYLEQRRFCKEEEYDKASNLYFSALDYIYGQELREIIANEYDVAKIVFLLGEIPEDGIAYPEGDIEYSVACLGTWGDEGLPLYRNICYREAVNKLCDKALNSAIALNNKDLAMVIVEQYKENVEVTKSPNINVGHVEYTTRSKDAAMEKYNKKFGD